MELKLKITHSLTSLTSWINLHQTPHTKKLFSTINKESNGRDNAVWNGGEKAKRDWGEGQNARVLELWRGFQPGPSVFWAHLNGRWTFVFDIIGKVLNNQCEFMWTGSRPAEGYSWLRLNFLPSLLDIVIPRCIELHISEKKERKKNATFLQN